MESVLKKEIILMKNENKEKAINDYNNGMNISKILVKYHLTQTEAADVQLSATLRNKKGKVRVYRFSSWRDEIVTIKDIDNGFYIVESKCGHMSRLTEKELHIIE